MSYTHPAHEIASYPGPPPGIVIAAPEQSEAPDVPKAVFNMLDAVRRLQTVARMWGALQASEDDASDAFVAVGNCFRVMLTAFAAYGIDMRDVSSFLPDLRNVLEERLSEDPTPENVEQLMTQARTIIAGLLIGLRNKQSSYWQAVNARRPDPKW
ncbi:hypothetical protein M0805_005089 [Coniferiporia weirii]|nr:hypothetical protein M0805_005089 [Coniferiporia weirii]